MRRRDGIVFSAVDILLILFVVFLARSIDTSDAATPTKPPLEDNAMSVRLLWPLALDCDVDLQVRDPNGVVVNFINTHGPTFDLNHDDLGRSLDTTSRNEELAAARTTPPGEYAINAMLYSNHGGTLPVPVNLIVTTAKTGGKAIVTRDGTLRSVGQEITLARFRIDANGDMVPGSLNDLHTNLFKARG